MERNTHNRSQSEGREDAGPAPLPYNVFVGGTVRKKRRTLDEAAVDPNVEPKILKQRYQNIILRRSQARDLVTAPQTFPKHLIPLDEREENVEDEQSSEESGPEGTSVTLKIGPDRDVVDIILCEPNEVFLPLIKDDDTLYLDGICRAEDFPLRKEDGALIQKALASGAILPSDDSSTLVENMAGNLAARSSAIFGRIGYAVLLVYPTHCTAWYPRLEVDSEEQQLRSKLQYLLFTPTESFASQLSVMFNPLPVPQTSSDIWTFYTNAPLLSNPDDLFVAQPTHIFLLFPYGNAGRVQETIMADYLRLVHPECQLLSSSSPGDWSTFCKMTDGVLIAHESCVPLPSKIHAYHNLNRIVSQVFILHMPALRGNTLPSTITPRHGLWLERADRRILYPKHLQ